MALETGNRIADLVATNPEGATDFVAQGDDHIRLLKACIQGSLPNLGATAVTATGAEINHIAGVTSPLQAQIDAKLSSVAAAAAYQPLDADLSAIAALTTTAFGRGFLDLADLAATAVKLAAMVPTWSGLHVFNNEASIGKAANGAAAGLVVRNTGSGAGTLARIWLNDVTGNLGYLQGDPAGSTVSLRATDRNNVLDFWTGNSGGAQRVQIGAAGNVGINKPSSGITLSMLGDGETLSIAGANSYIAWHPTATGHAFALQAQDSVDGFRIYDLTDSSQRLTISNAGVVGVNDAGTIREAGFRHLPFITESTSARTLAAADNGKSVYCSFSGAVTITVPALAAGTVITIINDSGNAMSIVRSGSSLFWFNGASRVGSADRTLAYGGVATITSLDGGNMFLWGSGIS